MRERPREGPATTSARRAVGHARGLRQIQHRPRRAAQRQRWEVTVVATLPGEYGWLPRLLAHTPDVFVLPHFLQAGDFPRFFLYLIRSRHPDAVLVSNSLFAYTALPFLRTAAEGIHSSTTATSKRTGSTGAKHG